MDEQCYYRISIKGIVFDKKGCILLSRETNGKWEMLGGGLDHGETAADCLKREIKEEAGLEVTYISESPRYFITVPRVGSVMTTYMANIIYEIQLKDLDFTASDECQELAFFSIEDMRQIELFPNVQKLLDTLTLMKAA